MVTVQPGPSSPRFRGGAGHDWGECWWRAILEHYDTVLYRAIHEHYDTEHYGAILELYVTEPFRVTGENSDTEHYQCKHELYDNALNYWFLCYDIATVRRNVVVFIKYRFAHDRYYFTGDTFILTIHRFPVTIIRYLPYDVIKYRSISEIFRKFARCEGLCGCVFRG